MFVRLPLLALAVLFLCTGRVRAGRLSWGVGIRGEPLTLDQVQGCILAKPYHSLSPELRQRRAQAMGLFEMRIDPKTGIVKEVRVLRTTHDAVLDHECAIWVVGWQFKPGAITIARLQIGLSFAAPGSNANKWIY